MEYEGLNAICYQCGMVGHRQEVHRLNPTNMIEKENSQEPKSCAKDGEWMKVPQRRKKKKPKCWS